MTARRFPPHEGYGRRLPTSDELPLGGRVAGGIVGAAVGSGIGRSLDTLSGVSPFDLWEVVEGSGSLPLSAHTRAWLEAGAAAGAAGAAPGEHSIAAALSLATAAGGDLDRAAAAGRASAGRQGSFPSPEASAALVCAASVALHTPPDRPIHPGDLIEPVVARIRDGSLVAGLRRAGEVAADAFGRSTLSSLSAGGRADDCIPLGLALFLRHQRAFRTALRAAARAGEGGRIVCPLVGGLVGARVGQRGIPRRWRDRLSDAPASDDPVGAGQACRGRDRGR